MSDPKDRLCAAMRNCFDRFTKEVLEEAMSRAGEARPGLECAPDAQIIDVWFEPRGEPSPELGLLGRMAREPCLIESYSGTVDLDEARECLRKQLAQYRVLKNQSAEHWGTPPNLWILSTGFPATVKRAMGFEQAAGWPPGVYRMGEDWRAWLVVRSRLPRDRATLLLRATGIGRVLLEALEDLAALQEGAFEKRVLVRRLALLHLELKTRPSERSPEEEEFVMNAEQMLQELEAKARMEGREEAARQMLLDVYQARFGAMPLQLSTALSSLQGLERLRRLVQACATQPAEKVQQMIVGDLH